VRRLLAELLENALRYTAGRAIAHIDVLWDAEDAAYVVRDDGVGFDDARAEQAFAIFGRLDPARDGDRTGIGLAVAQRIVTRHGGRLWVHSRPEGGAAFRFTLAPPGG
jgi:signal transduction histidine kinase